MQEQSHDDIEKMANTMFQGILSSEEEQVEQAQSVVSHNKWVNKTVALIRREIKDLDPALKKSAVHFCDRVESTRVLGKKETLLLRFIYLRKYDRTGLAGCLYEKVFDSKSKNSLVPWVFPRALHVAQNYRKRKSGLASLPVRLALATLDMADYYQGEDVLNFLPHSFVDGNEFVMWFSESVLYLKKKKEHLKRHKRFSSASFHSDVSEISGSDDNFFCSSSDDESEATYHSIGDQASVGFLTGLDLSEDSNASDDNQDSKKLSVLRKNWEKAKSNYEEGMREFNTHILKYPLFRALVKAHFHEAGFRVHFQDKEMRCHELNSQGSVVNNTVENAWPVPQEYNLCSHHKNTSSNPFVAIKQPQLRSIVRMAAYPDERLNANIKNHTPLFKHKQTQKK